MYLPGQLFKTMTSIKASGLNYTHFPITPTRLLLSCPVVKDRGSGKNLHKNLRKLLIFDSFPHKDTQDPMGHRACLYEPGVLGSSHLLGIPIAQSSGLHSTTHTSKFLQPERVLHPPVSSLGRPTPPAQLTYFPSTSGIRLICA